MTLKRLFFLILCFLLLAGCAAAPETIEPEFILTYAENQPEGYPTVLAAQRFAQRCGLLPAPQLRVRRT